MIVCVCGGRDYADADRVFATLDAIHEETPITLLVQGGQSQVDQETGERVGADYLAKWWAMLNGIPGKSFPAQWQKYGPAAGPLRNTEMAQQSGMELCVAFPRANGSWGNGTRDMIRNARLMGVEVRKIQGDNNAGQAD